MAARHRTQGFTAFAAAVMCVAAPAHAITGNFLPQVLSIIVAVPFLLLVPAIGIARGPQPWKRKLPWVLAALATGILSFGSLWWALQVHHLAAGPGWPIVYLWVLPPYLLWPVARRLLHGGGGEK